MNLHFDISNDNELIVVMSYKPQQKKNLLRNTVSEERPSDLPVMKII